MPRGDRHTRRTPRGDRGRDWSPGLAKGPMWILASFRKLGGRQEGFPESLQREQASADASSSDFQPSRWGSQLPQPWDTTIAPTEFHVLMASDPKTPSDIFDLNFANFWALRGDDMTKRLLLTTLLVQRTLWNGNEYKVGRLRAELKQGSMQPVKQARWPWVSYLTAGGLGFLFCK